MKLPAGRADTSRSRRGRRADDAGRPSPARARRARTRRRRRPRRRSTSPRPRRCSGCRSATVAGRRRLLDPRAPVLRRHAPAASSRPAQPAGAPQAEGSAPLPAAVSAARSHHDAGPAVQRRRTGSARSSSPSRIPAAPAGRIWPSRCSKRVCAHGPISGNTCRTSGSCTTGGDHDYQAAADVVRHGQPTRRRAVVAEVAGRDDAGAGRRPAVVAPDVAGDRAVGRERWLQRNEAERRWRSSTRSTRSTRCSRSSSGSRARPARRRATGRRSSAPGRSAASRSIRPACRTRFDAGRHASTSPASPLCPLPEEPQRPAPQP